MARAFALRKLPATPLRHRQESPRVGSFRCADNAISVLCASISGMLLSWENAGEGVSHGAWTLGGCIARNRLLLFY
jgi:hypothetical protein